MDMNGFVGATERVGRLLATGLCALLIGCGDTPPSGSTAAKTPIKSAKKAASEKPAATSSSKHVRVDADGRKWVADIPYDVFFNDPLAVVSDTNTVASTPGNTAAPITPAPAESPTPANTAPTAAGDDWKSYISMELLQDETKRLRNHLTASLQSQGTYNGNYKELQVDGAMFAAIAGIVANHPESITWKPNSRFVREFGFELSESAKGLGKEGYTKSQNASEKLVAVLDGNLPADAGDPPPTRPFGETANRAGVMKRIEKASEWMRSNINTEAKFKGELEQIQKEATLLAALAKVVSDESYDSASEEDYQGFAKRLLDGGREAAAAAQEQAYPKFGEALNKIQNACAECHASYGNG
jgi:cytochrome c556